MSIITNHQQDNHGTTHVHRDDYGARMGMWLFLFTEVLLFGGLFILYMAYRYQYGDDFHWAGKELNLGIGTLNTIILLTSSLTMALAIVAMQKAKKNLSIFFMLSTIVMALGFMVNKVIEWSAKISHGIFPGAQELLDKPKGEQVFFGMYYAMTGLHALHIIVGVTILLFILSFIIRDKITPDNYVKLENSGLYWHLVDLIWIFLFPLFYLIH